MHVCCWAPSTAQTCPALICSPLWDMPTDRHFWKRQYWHLLRFFFWILQRRSHLSYSSFRRMVLRKKPWGGGQKGKMWTKLPRSKDETAVKVLTIISFVLWWISNKGQFRETFLQQNTQLIKPDVFQWRKWGNYLLIDPISCYATGFRIPKKSYWPTLY